MKKWIKYIAVVCCFLIMAGIFVPDSGTKVKASESGNDQGIEEQTEEPTEEQTEEPTEEQTEEPTEEQTKEPIEEQSTTGTLTVHWNSEGISWGNSITVSGVQTDSGSNFTYEITFPTDAPTKNGATFAGWSCSDQTISGQTYQCGATATLACSSDITEITFIAQWIENNSIAVSFVLGDGATWVYDDGTPVNLNWTTGPGSGNIYQIYIPTYIPTKENFKFNGWQYTSSNIEMGSGTATEGQTIEIDGTKVSAGAAITFTAQWLEISELTDGIISDAGTYSLSQGEQYTLGDGKWTVSGDNGSTEYVGGNQFCVETTGDYTFTKTEG